MSMGWQKATTAQREKGEKMADRWLYDPKYCEGRLCTGDCDNCHVADEMDDEMAKERE